MVKEDGTIALHHGLKKHVKVSNIYVDPVLKSIIRHEKRGIYVESYEEKDAIVIGIMEDKYERRI
jgi:hypothetical protein